MHGEGSWLWDTPDGLLGCSCWEINVKHCMRGQVAAAPGSGQVELSGRGRSGWLVAAAVETERGGCWEL